MTQPASVRVVTWAGRDFAVSPLPASAMGAVARLASTGEDDRMVATTDVLNAAGVDVEDVADALWATSVPADILDFVALAIETDSDLPWRSTVSLCQSAVKQWSSIRGQLIVKGIADPINQIGSLGALMDAVIVMLLEGIEKDDERESVRRDLFRRPSAVADEGPPPGWEDGASLEGLS